MHHAFPPNDPNAMAYWRARRMVHALRGWPPRSGHWYGAGVKQQNGGAILLNPP